MEALSGARPMALSVVSTALLVLVFVSGVVEAVLATRSLGNVYSVTRKDGTKLQGQLLRNLDKGVLMYDLASRQSLFLTNLPGQKNR
jgi:hypothetical protein